MSRPWVTHGLIVLAHRSPMGHVSHGFPMYLVLEQWPIWGNGPFGVFAHGSTYGFTTLAHGQPMSSWCQSVGLSRVWSAGPWVSHGSGVLAHEYLMGLASGMGLAVVWRGSPLDLPWVTHGYLIPVHESPMGSCTGPWVPAHGLPMGSCTEPWVGHGSTMGLRCLLMGLPYVSHGFLY